MADTYNTTYIRLQYRGANGATCDVKDEKGCVRVFKNREECLLWIDQNGEVGVAYSYRPAYSTRYA